MLIRHVRALAGWLLITAVSNPVLAEGDEHAGHMGMDHSPQEIPAALPKPTIELQLFEDAMSGYNLQIDVTNYTFKPPQTASQKPYSVLEGHAHLYINGKKIARLYGPNAHLPGKLLQSGLNKIVVTLNSHSHGDWSQGGQAIRAEVGVDTTARVPMKYRLSSLPPDN